MADSDPPLIIKDSGIITRVATCTLHYSINMASCQAMLSTQLSRTSFPRLIGAGNAEVRTACRRAAFSGPTFARSGRAGVMHARNVAQVDGTCEKQVGKSLRKRSQAARLHEHPQSFYGPRLRQKCLDLFEFRR